MSSSGIQTDWIDRIDSNGQAISNHSNYESINNSAHIFDARLIFKKIRYKNFGIYTFQVNNSGGSAIRKINFTLKGNYIQINSYYLSTKLINKFEKIFYFCFFFLKTYYRYLVILISIRKNFICMQVIRILLLFVLMEFRGQMLPSF